MKHYERGTKVWVQWGKKKDAGIVLDSAFSHEGNYDQCKVEILVNNLLSLGQLLRQVYPHPIQSYKLTARYTLLPGEEA